MTRDHHPATPRAFTLIELVIVVAILGVVAAIAIPRFASATTRYRLDLAVSRLEGDAVLAGEWARAAGVAHVMVFDTATDTYTINSRADGSGATRTTVNLSDGPYQSAITKVTLTSGGAKLVFDGYGRPAEGASVTLSIGKDSRLVVLSENITRPEPPADEEGDVLDILDLPGDIVDGLLGGLLGG